MEEDFAFGEDEVQETVTNEEEEEEEFVNLESVVDEPPKQPSAVPVVVSEAKKQWKAENDQRKAARDAELAKAKSELQASAEATLAQVKQARLAQMQERFKRNREEQAKHQQLLVNSGDFSWQKVKHLCDLQTETKDKERMRGLLLGQ